MNEASNLTGQEKKVVELAARGLSNREIGVQLTITEKTVKFHLTKVYKKLGVNRHTLILKYGTLVGQAPTPDEHAAGLLMDVVRLGKAGLPYTNELGQLKVALDAAPVIKKVIAESLQS